MSEEKEAIKAMFAAPTAAALIHDTLRTFASGATRSPLGNKLEYEGYISPLVLQRYAEYMRQHQIQSDGNKRAADNWQKGIDQNSYMDSMTRHFFDVWLHHRGCPEKAMEPIEEALCALMFNVMGMLFERLGGKR